MADAGYTVEFKVTTDVLEGDLHHQHTSQLLVNWMKVNQLLLAARLLNLNTVLLLTGETIEPSELATVKIENYSKQLRKLQVKASVNSLELNNVNIGR